MPWHVGLVVAGLVLAVLMWLFVKGGSGSSRRIDAGRVSDSWLTAHRDLTKDRFSS